MEAKKSKFLKLLCLVLVLAMLLAGCASGGGTENSQPSSQAPESSESATTPVDTVTLKVWGAIQPEYGYDEIVKNFNEEYKDKGIQIEYTRFVNDNDGNLQVDTYLMGGNEIDVFLTYNRTRLLNRMEAGFCMDLSDILTSVGYDYKADLGAEKVEPYYYNGKCLSLPTKYENPAWMFINKDMFESAGITIPYDGWTYDEFRDAASKLTKGEGLEKVYGIYWWSNSSYYVKSMTTSPLGSNALYKDDTTQSNFDDPLWEKGVQLVADTMLNDKTAFSRADEMAEKLNVGNTFLAGRSAMSTAMSQIRLIKDLQNYPHDFTTALVPMPVPGEEYREYATQSHLEGNGDMISINSKTAHAEQCAEFVKWYVSGGMLPLAKGGRIPLTHNLTTDEIAAVVMEGAEDVFDLQSVKNYIALATSNTKVDPLGPAESQITTVYLEETEAAFLGTKNVKQALGDAKTRADALIKEAK